MKYLIIVLCFLWTLQPVHALDPQLNIVVVFDGSGSMAERFRSDRNIRKIDAAKKVLIQLLSELPPNSKLGIITFSGSFDGWSYKLGSLDKQEFVKAINNISAGGGTPLGRYMKEGANALLELRAKQKSGVYKLIIVTDGESSDDAETPLIGQYGILSKGLKVEVVGVDMKSSHTLATRVSYRSADSPDQLHNAIKAVLAESTGKDADSQDYDVIASLDPNLCMVALQAISEFDNYPIGVKPPQDNSINIESSTNWPLWAGIIIGLVLGVLGLFVIIMKQR